MKRLLWIAIILITLSSVLAVNVERLMPEQAEQGSVVEVEFVISRAIPEETLTIEDTYPDGYELQDWEIEGAVEQKDNLSIREQPGKFAWSFTPKKKDAAITYLILVPDNAPVANHSMMAVWFDQKGFGKNNATLEILEKTILNETSGADVTNGTTTKRKIYKIKRKTISLPNFKLPSFNLELSGWNKEIPETWSRGLAIMLIVIAVTLLLFSYHKRGRHKYYHPGHRRQ